MITSLQETNKKFLEMISELQKKKKKKRPLILTLPLLFLPCILVYLNCLIQTLLPFLFQLFHFLLLPFAQQRRIKYKKAELIIASLRENRCRRNVSSSVLIYTPWTWTAFKALAKEFPNPSQDLLGFAEEFELTISSYYPGFSDLCQLIQLLVSEKEEKKWIKKAGWKHPLMDLGSQAYTEHKDLPQKLLKFNLEFSPKTLDWTIIQYSKDWMSPFWTIMKGLKKKFWENKL